MSYQLSIPRSVTKAIEKLPDQVYDRVDAAILALKEEQHPRGSRKLSGGDEYRVRVGDYRIIYAVDDTAELVEVVRVAHRREVYRKR